MARASERAGPPSRSHSTAAAETGLEADPLRPLPMVVTVPGTWGRRCPFPNPSHLFLPLWVTPATLPSICASGWLQARPSNPPAWLDEHLSQNEGETGLIPHRVRTGSPGQGGKPPGSEHHHQAALGPGDLRVGTGTDTLTSGLDGLATPLLSLPEPHLTPRLPLRSLGNRNAPMTPSNKLAGSLPLRAVNIHEFPPWGQQVVCPCTLPVHPLALGGP